MATAIQSPREAIKAAIAANNARHRAPGDHERLKETMPPAFVFSVAPFLYRVSLGSHGIFIIPAKPEGARYSGPVEHGGKPYITGVLPLDYDQGDAQGRMGIFHDFGAEVAKDVVGIGSSSPAFGLGTTNREHWGVFISETATRENPEPSEAELQAAEARLMKMAMLWFEDGQKLAKEGKLDKICGTHRWGAAHANQKVEWSANAVPMGTCQWCQEPMKPGARQHGCGAVYSTAGEFIGMWSASGLIPKDKLEGAAEPAPRVAAPIPGQPIRQAK
jgi:hypothetical protein